MWVAANLTENSLGHPKPGNQVDIVLDVWPDKTLRGHVRNITYGVTGTYGVIGPEYTSKPGALPTVQSARDWLRNAQRFPVLIDSENPEKATQLGGRVGSQVSVLVYAGDQPLLNAFGRAIMGLSSVLSCVY